MILPFAMIIEDDPKLSKIYETVFHQCEYETLVLEDGRAASQALEKHVPDLILLDLHLPYVSGKELLEKIKTTKHLSDIPVIVVTADLFSAKDMEKQVEHVILKTHGVTHLIELVKQIRPTLKRDSE